MWIISTLDRKVYITSFGYQFSMLWLEGEDIKNPNCGKMVSQSILRQTNCIINIVFSCVICHF